MIVAPSRGLPDFASFRRQETIFGGLNLALLLFLFTTQLLWPRYLGRPHAQLLVILGLGMVAYLSELVWLHRQQAMSWTGIVRLTWTMIAMNMAIAFGLASFSYRRDVQYFTLVIPAIFQAAFRLSLGATLLIVAVTDGLMFFWVWNYFRVYPPVDPKEYFESGTIALIYAVMGWLMWTLVNHLRTKQAELTASIAELERTEAQLKVEEKLAAVGRFSSAIAHEIRNPVAMISSALATAANRGVGSTEGQEMFEIATKEASRLERLTTDFLAYARPRPPAKILSDLADSIGYTAEICRPRAAGKSIEIHCECPTGLWVQIDGGQLQQALLNLAMNAVEASQPGSTVTLRGRHDDERVYVEVENGNGPIPAATVACMFEPFFTTKPSGTGLGLAITRNIVLAHGGDIVLAQNDAETIRFDLWLPSSDAKEDRTS